MVFQGPSLLPLRSTGDTFLFLASTPHLSVYQPVISKQIELGLGNGGRNEAGLGKSLAKMLHFLKRGLSSFCNHTVALRETLFSVGFATVLVCVCWVHCGLIISGVGLWVIYNLFFILFVGSHFLRGHVQFLFHFSFFFFLKVRVPQIF